MIIIILIIIIIKVIHCSTCNKPERPGITESMKSLRHLKMNVKIISFEATFNTVLVGGRTVTLRDN